MVWGSGVGCEVTGTCTRDHIAAPRYALYHATVPVTLRAPRDRHRGFVWRLSPRSDAAWYAGAGHVRGDAARCAGVLDRMPTPEDLIILEAVAHRPKDLVDIEAVIGAHRHLDAERIRVWVQQFADLLELPELWTDAEKLLAKAKT